MSLDDIIKERRSNNRSIRGRGRDSRGRRGGRGRGIDRGGIDRGGREGRGREWRQGRGGRQNFNIRDRRRFVRDDRPPRSNFGRRRTNSMNRSGGTRLFVKDLPKTVNNNDLRVLYYNLGYI
jgi:hypothetical protein